MTSSPRTSDSNTAWAEMANNNIITCCIDVKLSKRPQNILLSGGRSFSIGFLSSSMT